MALGERQARGWDHTSLAVANLDDALAFYQTAFGYETLFVERDMTAQIQRIVGLPGLRCDLAQLRSPISGHTLELIAFRAVPLGHENHGPTRVGAAHLAFTVRDLGAAVEEVRALGATMLGEATDFEDGRSVYCREPSGTVFELHQLWPTDDALIGDASARQES